MAAMATFLMRGSRLYASCRSFENASDAARSMEAISLISAPATNTFSSALAITTTVTSSIRSTAVKASKSSRPNATESGFVGGRLRSTVAIRPSRFSVTNSYAIGSADLEHDGGGRVARGAAGEEQVPSPLHRQLLDPLDHETGPRGRLRMAEDEGGTEVVHAVRVEPHHLRHDDVVRRKRVVRLDRGKIRRLDPRLVEGHLRGRRHGGRHERLFRPGEPEGDDPDLHLRVGAQLLRLFPGGHEDAAVPVGRGGLGAVRVRAFGEDGLQSGQSLFGGGKDPLVGRDGDSLLSGKLDLDG